jgi:hypothetical protein
MGWWLPCSIYVGRDVPPNRYNIAFSTSQAQHRLSQTSINRRYKHHDSRTLNQETTKCVTTWQRGREPIYATENRHDTTPPEECSLFKIPRPQLSPSIVTEGATLRNDHGVITPINTPAVHILESHSWDSVPSRSWVHDVHFLPFIN